ncbi:MAG: hemolysin family protein [Verrucomicrobiota bacterium]|nr:hemolysin family protein [Verrucomicrobiota bacterium]
MESISLELLLIFLSLGANALFALAEIAIVSSRKTRLQHLADEGHHGARLALELANNPARFLSTVQVGITLVGVMAGAIAGASLARAIEPWIDSIPLFAGRGESISVGLMVALVTFLSVVLGELVPKRIALSNPERMATLLAAPMRALSRIATPIVVLLEASSNLLMRFFPLAKEQASTVSEEEMRVMLTEGENAGVFHPQERAMLESVFDLDEQTAGDLMTPRGQVIWLDVHETDEENWRVIVNSNHSHLPVCRGRLDEVLGVVSVKSLWANLALTGQVRLKDMITPALFVPTTMPARTLIEEVRKARKHVAIVLDEFGGVEGLVTLHDLLEAIVGRLPEKERKLEPTARLREDGSWMVDAQMDIDAFKTALSIERELPGEEEKEFQTVAGFLLQELGCIPQEGDTVTWMDYHFEIVDMDRQRIDKVQVKKITTNGDAPVVEQSDGEGG